MKLNSSAREPLQWDTGYDVDNDVNMCFELTAAKTRLKTAKVGAHNSHFLSKHRHVATLYKAASRTPDGIVIVRLSDFRRAYLEHLGRTSDFLQKK